VLRPPPPPSSAAYACAHTAQMQSNNRLLSPRTPGVPSSVLRVWARSGPGDGARDLPVLPSALLGLDLPVPQRTAVCTRDAIVGKPENTVVQTTTTA